MATVNAAAELLRGRSDAQVRTEPCRQAHVTRPYVDKVLPWGKFKGESMSRVALSYLAWIVDNVDDDRIREPARTWLHWRTAR